MINRNQWSKEEVAVLIAQVDIYSENRGGLLKAFAETSMLTGRSQSACRQKYFYLQRGRLQKYRQTYVSVNKVLEPYGIKVHGKCVKITAKKGIKVTINQ